MSPDLNEGPRSGQLQPSGPELSLEFCLACLPERPNLEPDGNISRNGVQYHLSANEILRAGEHHIAEDVHSAETIKRLRQVLRRRCLENQQNPTY